nr:uncharacterized protein LOC112733844 isoform X2 [Arachis hypogaea]
MAEEERISAAARVVGGSCAAIRITVLPPLKLVEEGAIVRRSYCCSCSCSILLPCFWFSQLPESLPPWVLSLELLGANDGAARKPYCCCFIISLITDVAVTGVSLESTLLLPWLMLSPSRISFVAATRVVGDAAAVPVVLE